MNDVAFGC